MNYDILCQQVYDYLAQDPAMNVQLGIEKHFDILPDPSLEHIHELAVQAGDLLNRIKSFDSSQLGFDEKLDMELAYELIASKLHALNLSIDGINIHQKKPLAGDHIGDALFNFFINDQRPSEKRIKNIINRLKGVPEYCIKLINMLNKPVKRWVDIDIEKVEELPSLFATIRNWANEAQFPDMYELDSAIVLAEKSLETYISTLRMMEYSQNIHLGQQQAETLVQLKGIDLDFNQLHGMAKDFMKRNEQDIRLLHQKLINKHELAPQCTVDELQKYLNHKYKVSFCKSEGENPFQGILDRYKKERDNILRFITDSSLFPVIDNQEMVILKTPGFMEPSIPAGAMMPPPSFREGVKTSLVYLTLREELLDEHTELSIPMMMVHEGIPGHHLQLSWAASHKSIIRKFVDALDQAEGWTTMLEDYMLDIGYVSELADEARFIGKRDIARIGARVAIDLYFMTGNKSYLDIGVECDVSSDDPFVCAGNLLQKVTGFVDARVQAELNWYSQEHGYPLCYLTGNHLVWELKRSFEQKADKALPVFERDYLFHKTFLEAGNMPVKYLRKVFTHKGLL